MFSNVFRVSSRRAVGVAGAACASSAAYATYHKQSVSCDTKDMILGAAVGVATGFGLHKVLSPASQGNPMRPPRKIIILFGPPGAGKGTHGPKIEKAFDIPRLSTGDMLWAAVAAQTDIGMKAKDLMTAGKLVGDDIVISIIKDRIREQDCAKGFILDGFPRNLHQAKTIDKLLAEGKEKVNCVISLDGVPDAVLQERIGGRWVHEASGRSYHVKFAPPFSYLEASSRGAAPSTQNMIDDHSGQPLMQRPDDTVSALVQRLALYHSVTMPVLDHYRPEGIVTQANANQSRDAVWAEISVGFEK